jgi:hypothetical protein
MQLQALCDSDESNLIDNDSGPCAIDTTVELNQDLTGCQNEAKESLTVISKRFAGFSDVVVAGYVCFFPPTKGIENIREIHECFEIVEEQRL